MPETASLVQVVQIGVEATPGTSVPANKRLASLQIVPRVQANVASFRPMGAKFTTIHALGKEWTEAALSGQLTYSEVIYALASCMRNVTPTQITPPSGLAYRWVFTPAQTAADTVATYTVEHGQSGIARKFTYGIVNEFGVEITRENATISGSMFGQPVQEGITMTASPTMIEQVPVLPTQVDVYLDTSAASIGTTKLNRPLRVSFSLGDRFSQVWAINSAVSGFAGHVETAPNMRLGLRLMVDSQGMSLLNSLRNSSTLFVRVKATGALIETGNNYLFQIDMAGSVVESGGFDDENGVFVVDWTLEGKYDSGWGKAVEVTVINKQSAL